VKYRHLLAATAAAALSAILLGADARAQVGPAAAPPAAAPRASGNGSTVLLNVGWLFENHPALKQMKTEMKGDVERADEQVKAKREEIKRLVEQLEVHRGKPEFKVMEEQIAKAQTDLNLQIALQRKEFMLREAKMYYDTYREIQDEVNYYCQQNGVSLVLRFSANQVDTQVPESVLEFINRPVVWYAGDRDITGIVLDSIVKRRGGSRTANPTIPSGPGVPFKR